MPSGLPQSEGGTITPSEPGRNHDGTIRRRVLAVTPPTARPIWRAAAEVLLLGWVPKDCDSACDSVCDLCVISDDLIPMEVLRNILLLVMAAMGLATFGLSHKLKQRIEPLTCKLARSHQDLNALDIESGELVAIQSSYIDLLEHVDDVDTAEFSAGIIETLRLPFFRWIITAADAQGWIRQAPGILISFGLLGTFAGLTMGLAQIGDLLGGNLAPAAAMGALASLVAPMSTAFQTSLLGLFLSLIVLIWTQLNGTRNCLDRCESLLSSWLETVLPRQLGRQIMTPLRQSLVDLNVTAEQLPSQVFDAVEQGMNRAFEAKLNDIFNRHSELATEAQTSVHNLARFASVLSESGQDFVHAAQAFSQSDFASTLQSSVAGLEESRQYLGKSTAILSERMDDLTTNLMSIQADWQLIAKTSEQELATSRVLGQTILEEIKSLHNASQALLSSSEAATEATKQLREARLEVMRDRKLAIDTASAIQKRLESDSSAAESCEVFASALAAALSNWNRNTNRLDSLTVAYIESMQRTKLEGEQELVERNRVAHEIIDQIQQKIQQDLSQAIEEQRQAVASLAQPTESAQALAQTVLSQIEQLQSRINGINTLSLAKQDIQGRG